MYVFRFTPQPRTCKRCNTDKYVILVQLINGGQRQVCNNCKNYV